MKTLAQFGVLLLSAPIFFPALNAQTDTQAKLVGKWTLNTTKWQSEGAVPRPKQATLVISKASSSHFKWEVTTIFTNGSRSVMGFDGAIDGKPYEYKGAQPGARMAFIENSGTMEGLAKFPGGGKLHQMMTLSPDGNTITAQCRLDSPSGPVSWTELWERVLDKKRN